MLKLRTYKPIDAQTILSWCKDEISFRKWTSDRYDSFPITPEDMNQKYIDYNGDCAEPDNFYPMTAFDENGVVGHLILRYTGGEKRTIRFGFVIVDDAKRGLGYGKEMLKLALKYAFEIFGAERVTLGVFDNNPSAYRCYRAVGFQDVTMKHEILFEICGEKWKVIELEMEREAYENKNIFCQTCGTELQESR